MTYDPRYGATLGARVLEGAVLFRAYATECRACEVRLFDVGTSSASTHPMTERGDGIFELEIASVGAGALYAFVLDGKQLPDPYARFLPHGVDGPAMVSVPGHVFRHPSVERPLREHVLYELHVGTFTTEGTYAAAAERLRELAALGVTAVELMPVAAFAGTRGWGYDGVAWFAPFAGYGTPDELRAFVDAAHGLGLSVILDVVYSHFGPSGNHLSAYCPEYFSSSTSNAWGDAPNFSHPAMRAYVVDNALYWLDEFLFDGLRLDAVHAIEDSSEKHILGELVARVRAEFPNRILIAEDDRNDARRVTDLGFDGVWADDFHHQLRVSLTHENDGYYAAYEPDVKRLAKTIERGWLYEGQTFAPTGRPRGTPADALPAEAFIYCVQNHDQVGNRAFGTRLTEDVTLDAYRMASMVLLFLPMTPLLWMGQEWAASTPFLYFTDHDPELGELVSRGRREEFASFRAFGDPTVRARIPDPQAVSTFERSRLRWDEREAPEHARTLELYRTLLRLRREDPVLRSTTRDDLEARAFGHMLRVRCVHDGGTRLLLANFGATPLRIADFTADARTRVLVRTDVNVDEATLAPFAAVALAEEGS